jgi:hypothetical protein
MNPNDKFSPATKRLVIDQSDSIDKVEGHAFVAVEKSDELAIVGRCHVVVDRVEIPMIGNV